MNDRHQFLGIEVYYKLFLGYQVGISHKLTSKSIANIGDIHQNLSTMNEPILALEYLDSLGWELVSSQAVDRSFQKEFIFRKKIGY